MMNIVMAAIVFAVALSGCAPGAPNARPGSISVSGRGKAVPSGAATPASEIDKNSPPRSSAGPAVR
jgi:hypothetical protein